MDVRIVGQNYLEMVIIHFCFIGDKSWYNAPLQTGDGDNNQRVRSSLAVIESGKDQNVSTLQKFTAECSLSTLNGRITMTSL